MVLLKMYGAEFVTAVGTPPLHEQLEWQRRKQRVLNRSRLAPWLIAISSPADRDNRAMNGAPVPAFALVSRIVTNTPFCS
jgi:hypothetical protein